MCSLLHELVETLAESIPGLEINPTRTRGHGYDLQSDDFEVLHLDSDGQCILINEIHSRDPGAGAGPVVIDEIVRFCDEQGLAILAVDVRPQAMPFWERHGFVPIWCAAPHWAHQKLFPDHLALVS